MKKAYHKGKYRRSDYQIKTHSRLVARNSKSPAPSPCMATEEDKRQMKMRRKIERLKDIRDTFREGREVWDDDGPRD